MNVLMIEILNEWNIMRVISTKAFPTDQPTNRLGLEPRNFLSHLT